MPGAFRHDAMLKINHDGRLRKVERSRDEANSRIILANEASRKAASHISRKNLDRIRRRKGEEARERDRPNYATMHPNKVLAARVFHQLYDLCQKKRKRAIDVFREFDTDDSGTVDRKEFQAGCKSLGMDFGGKKAHDEVFDAIDEDGSGELDYWEVEKAIKRAGKYPPPYEAVQHDPQNIVATHFTDMKEGFRAILKFKNKLRKTREDEQTIKAKRMAMLKLGQGSDSSSSDEDENDNGTLKQQTKDKNRAAASSGDEYDDDEDQFEEEGEGDEETASERNNGVGAGPTFGVDQLRQSLLKKKKVIENERAHGVTADDSEEDEPKEYTLKDLAMWVNMEDPGEIINNPAVARAAAQVPQAVRRVAAKLHNLMKRERLGIKTMFQCLDSDGSGILEVKELHDGLLQYLDIDLSLEDLKTVLDHCDKSFDGQIDFEEFEKAFLWADMKRMARITKRQNHADRHHYKSQHIHRSKMKRERAGGNIYRVPDAAPLPTKEEQATFPDGRPRQLPFWLRPRDSPHSRPWKNSTVSSERTSDPTNADAAETAAEIHRRSMRRERHRKRCAKLRVQKMNISVVTPHTKTMHASDILAHMDDAEIKKDEESRNKSPTSKKSPKAHARDHVKTLPPESGMPTLKNYSRITTEVLEQTMEGNGGSNSSSTMVAALNRRRNNRSSSGGGTGGTGSVVAARTADDLKQRMRDAKNLYTTPPLLYGAKEGQGFSTSPKKVNLPPKITPTSGKRALIAAMRSVGILEDKIGAQHLNQPSNELFNFHVVVSGGGGGGGFAAGASELRPATATVGEDGVRTHMASWNPRRVGVRVSPVDDVVDDELNHYGGSPQAYFHHPRQQQSEGRLVSLSRIPRRQLLRKKKLRRRVRREVEALQRVHGIETNRFIQRIVAVMALPTELVLVKLSPEGGTLRQLLEKRGKGGSLGVKPTRFYAAEIVLAIEYLHKKGIIHRDIKLENVRLGANGHVVLGGFSLALPDFTGIEHEIVGSPQCMAPEMIAGDGYGRGVDWWGLGVLLHDMLIGKSPFNADTPERLFHQITHANVKITGAQFSKTTQDFVESLLVRKPQDRLGGANRGGVFGLRFHHFFTCPKNPESSIDWNEVRAGNVPAPFHLSAITRATAATNAYDQAKDLGFAKPPALPENHNTTKNDVMASGGGGGLPPRPTTRGSMGSRGSSGYGRRGARGDSPLREQDEEQYEYEDEDDYEREGEEEVTVQSFVPYSYPAPLTAGSLANEMGPAGMDVFGMKSRSSTAEGGEGGEDNGAARAVSEVEVAARPSTSERAIPFQFQLASIQAGKTAELVREEEAAVRYGVAVNQLAAIQADKLVEKELQSQHMLSHPYD